MTPVLVTGGAGFIGSHLVRALLGAGRGVVVVDDLSTGDAGRLDPAVALEPVDIVDTAALDAVVDAARPSAVFHLAAKASVTGSMADPRRDCAVNVQGTLNVLEAAGRHRAPVVYTSTGGALYGDDAPRPTSETVAPAPPAPYGASKLAGEIYVRTWAQLTGVAHSVCRLGNVYGPGQTPHGEAGVVAIFSHLLHRGETPVMYGHGRASRDYIHVADVVAALQAASGRGGTYNIATGVATEVQEILALLQEAAGTRLVARLEPLRPGELEHSCIDPTRAREQLGWTPKTALRDGLRETYAALARASEAA